MFAPTNGPPSVAEPSNTKVSRRTKQRDAQQSAELLARRQARTIVRLQGYVEELERRLEASAIQRQAASVVSIDEELEDRLVCIRPFLRAQIAAARDGEKVNILHSIQS